MNLMRTENLYQNLNIRKNNFYPTGAEVPKGSVIMINITKEYFRLLEELKFEEAEKLRQKQLPPKLYKFVSLTDDEQLNAAKLKTLENQEVWFSSVEKLNDPFEFNGLYIDEKKFYDYFGSNSNVKLETLRKSIKLDKIYSILSLTANGSNCLPMWAYYTNNYFGYCVEYEIFDTEKCCAKNVMYESKRYPVFNIIINLMHEMHKFEITNKYSKEFHLYANAIIQQAFLKHNSWRHEREFRIVLPRGDKKSGDFSFSLSSLGLKTSRIIAGFNCEEKNLQKLKDISKKIGCGEVKRIQLCEDKYEFFL